MSEKPFRDEDVLLRCRDDSEYDPNEYVFVKSDKPLSCGVAAYRYDEWGHFHLQNPGSFHTAILLRQLQASQDRCRRLEEAVSARDECIKLLNGGLGAMAALAQPEKGGKA